MQIRQELHSQFVENRTNLSVDSGHEVSGNLK